MNTPSNLSDEHAALLAAYALGETDAETARQVEQLLATHPEYRSVVDSYKTVAQALPLAAPSATPTPDLRDRLLNRLDAEVEGKPLPAPQQERKQRAGLPFWQRLALVVNFLAIIGLIVWNVNLQQQQQADLARFQTTWGKMVTAMNAPGVQQYQLMSETPDATGAFLFAPDQQLGCLVVEGLPQLPEDQTYQVWLEQGGQFESPGTFRVNDAGNGWLVVDNATPIDDFSVVIVTVESVDGSTNPTNPPVIGGPLSV
ncbi:MAG: anti-sigma factor [Chloroflexota bacterium]